LFPQAYIIGLILKAFLKIQVNATKFVLKREVSLAKNSESGATMAI
jgi:hypothetical protein